MLAEVAFELGHVFNWMLWISGIILWIGLPAIYVLDRLSAGSSISVRSIDDDGYLDPGPSTLTDPSNRSNGDLLDDCITHRARLQFIHRTLCQRAGIDPNYIKDADASRIYDLITDAVFDGRNQFTCISKIDQLQMERKYRQHA